jgi:hypothetical protein
MILEAVEEDRRGWNWLAACSLEDFQSQKFSTRAKQSRRIAPSSIQVQNSPQSDLECEFAAMSIAEKCRFRWGVHWLFEGTPFKV